MTTKNILLLIALHALLLPAATVLRGQTNEGTEFWFGFMEHRNVGQNSMVAMITSKYSTSGVISIPLQNWQQNFSVAANGVTIITLPASAENTFSEIVDSKGIRVVSQLPVSVYTHQYHAMRSEATVVLPVSSLGQEYYVLTYTGYTENEVYPSEMLLVGMEDGTEVTVQVSTNTMGGHTPASAFTIFLNAGQTYQIQSKTGDGDMSGTYITGNKKFNVFGGARWTQVPAGCNFRDNLLEQMYPVNTWGRQFVSVPFAHMSYDIFRILAAENNTKVTVTGQTVSQYTLQAGEFVEYKSSDATFISANRPVMVAQYLIGSACGGYHIGDPSMLVLNSIEQIRDTVTLYNSSFEAIQENYITLIARTTDLPLVTFDGQNLLTLSPDLGTAGPNGEYSYARLLVNQGAHTIISAGCGVIASAYGYGDVESYAYGGGASFKPISANSLIPEGGCLHDTLHFDTRLQEPRHSFLWDLGDGSSSTQAAFDHVYQQLGTYHVTLYLTDNCLNRQDTLSRDLLVTLRQPLAVDGDPAGCVGTTLQLGAQDLAGANYVWSGPNGFFSPEQFPELSNVQVSAAGEYEVVGVISGCASFPATAKVTVYTLPQPYLGQDTVVCADDNYPLLILHPGDFAGYVWQNQSTAPEYAVLDSGLYTVVVVDEHGCTGSDSIGVRAICPSKYYVPNVFSPNDDGVNDYFEVFSKDLLALQLSIYDRWGELLFTSSAIDGRWDGKVRGKPVSPGVYVWMAQLEGYRKDGSTYRTVEKGSVTVIE